VYINDSESEISNKNNKSGSKFGETEKLTSIDKGGGTWDHMKNCSNRVELTICCSQYEVMNRQEYRHEIWRANDANTKPEFRPVYVHKTD